MLDQNCCYTQNKTFCIKSLIIAIFYAIFHLYKIFFFYFLCFPIYNNGLAKY